MKFNTAAYIVLAIAGLAAFVSLFILRPAEDNTTYIAAIVAFLTTMAGFVRLDQQVQEVHKSTNSRLDQLVDKTELLARLQGHTEGLAEGRAEANNKDK